MAFLTLTESKLKNWTVKYGPEEKVQQIMNQYRTFVSKNKIFQEFQKAYVEFVQVCDEYRRDGYISKTILTFNDIQEIFSTLTKQSLKSVITTLFNPSVQQLNNVMLTLESRGILVMLGWEVQQLVGDAQIISAVPSSWSSSMQN